MTEWTKVFKTLVVYLSPEYLKLKVIKRISELPTLKSAYPWRKVGFDLFCKIAEGKGEEIFRQEPLTLKFIVSMSHDTNWKIRR